ncbi:hypothetical protein BDV96DRAFT_218777 [Lophiotrema nucula]|uniref:NAD(P)-binding protein n=1 Tax=Lophiotrema nucula TaxID=690887 RepID=A0A6A5YSA6_9PLEO|nr:hypothetical protein BDV96DRAFT_218777 [Lophiotrema nucula]
MSSADNNLDAALAELASQRKDFTPDFIKTIHNKAYPAIDPTQPALSAAGKTILITGGATGIGFETARSFALAGAATVIIAARRAAVLEEAAASLSKEFPRTHFLQHTADIAKPESVKQLFGYAVKEAKNGGIDVLVTSAVYAQLPMSVLDVSVEEVRESFETNVIGNLDVVKNFLAAPSSGQKIVIDVATNAITNHFPMTPAYGASKSAFTFFMRHLQHDRPEIRVYSFHPGAIWTPLVKNAGFTREIIAPIEDDVELPGRFAVWLASPQAEFLKGRFLFAKWDVEDLVKNKAAFENDNRYSVVTLNI